MDGNIAKHLFFIFFFVKLPNPITEPNPKL